MHPERFDGSPPAARLESGERLLRPVENGGAERPNLVALGE